MEIQIKKSTTIRPAQETPKHCLQSSVLDLLLRAAHIPALYFFRQRQPNDSSNFFEAGLLKEALSEVLVPFYPMAGRLGRDQNGRIEIKCNGEGALFVEAKTSCVLEDLEDFESSLKIQKLVPTVDYDGDISSYPLLVAQVTYFKCGGVCLTVSMHHTLTDATSVFHFINTWAEMTRGVPISNPPSIDRTLLGIGVPTFPKFHHIEYDPRPSMNVPTQNVELEANPKPISSAILNLSVDQVNTLKAKSNQDHGTTNKFTRFETLAAHIWRCLCKAHGLSNDQASKLHIPINGRSRLNPPLPFGYIGNVTFIGATIGLAGDIQSESLNYTTEIIHKAIKRMDNEYLKSALCHGTRGYEPVRHSRIPYYESKPSGSGTISTGFALPWAHQENGSSSQPVCVGLRLDPSSRLSPRLATNSPNSTGSVCLNSKESRAIVFSTRTPLKHVSNNQHNQQRY